MLPAGVSVSLMMNWLPDPGGVSPVGQESVRKRCGRLVVRSTAAC